MHEGGIEYHRVGKDLIHQLIEAARAIIHVSESEAVTSEPGEGEQTRTLSEQELSIPRLEDCRISRHTTGSSTSSPICLNQKGVSDSVCAIRAS